VSAAPGPDASASKAAISFSEGQFISTPPFRLHSLQTDVIHAGSGEDSASIES
jgi:hypothetical protein